MTFATIGYLDAFGVYEDYFVCAGVGSASHVSWIGSVQAFSMLLAAFPAGYFFDMGYCRITPILGSAIFVFS